MECLVKSWQYIMFNNVEYCRAKLNYYKRYDEAQLNPRARPPTRRSMRPLQ